MQMTSNSIKALSTVLRAVVPTAVTLLLCWWLWGVVVATTAPARRGGPWSADEAMLGTAAALALAMLGWLALGVVLEAVAQMPGRAGRVATHLSAAVSPLVVRRAAAVLLGVSLGAVLTPATSVAATGAYVASAVGVTASPSPGPTGGAPADGGWPDPAFAPRPEPHPPVAEPGPTLPDPGFAPPPAPAPRAQPFVATPPVVRPQPDVSALAPTDRRSEAPSAREVVVRRGDSLWSIAARHLGQEPSDAEIASEWPRWYAANRAVIGPDPDLLLPGQVLLAPHGSPS